MRKMKVDVFDLSGKPTGKIDLPKVFSEPVRQDLILRAVLSSQSKRRQPYGIDVMAGKRTSAHYHDERHTRYTMMDREMARLPRLHGKLSPHLMWRVRFVPQARGGRKAHPPVIEKFWEQKINKKERQKAIRSAIAATAVKELVIARGHKVKDLKELPIVVDDKIQELKKTKNVVEFFERIGLTEELKRIEEKKIRAGKGKMRGRRYERKTGPLIVITKDKGVGKAVSGLPGVNICRAGNLSAEYLAPGASPGRLTIFTQSAVEKLK